MTQILLAMIVVANLVVIFTKAFASAHRVNEVLKQNQVLLRVQKQNQIIRAITKLNLMM